MGRPFGVRGSVIGIPFSIWMRGELRFLKARCAGSVVPVLVVLGVVRPPVVLIARCARCGTTARGADCPLWAARSCVARGSDQRSLCWA